MTVLAEISLLTAYKCPEKGELRQLLYFDQKFKERRRKNNAYSCLILKLPTLLVYLLLPS